MLFLDFAMKNKGVWIVMKIQDIRYYKYKTQVIQIKECANLKLHSSIHWGNIFFLILSTPPLG